MFFFEDNEITSGQAICDEFMEDDINNISTEKIRKFNKKSCQRFFDR
jgi:hypothetical protein